MKKCYIIGIIFIILFGSLVFYTIHTKKEANHYAGYINQRLNNLIKPSEGDISQADKFVKDALKSKQISADKINSLASLYQDAMFNIDNLEEIELYVTGKQPVGEKSKSTLFSIRNNLRNIQTKGKMIKLTDNQMLLFQKLNKFNSDLLSILKPTIHQQYDVKNDGWIEMLQQMDNTINQQYYGRF